MIPAKELRIDNWVKRNDMDGVFTIRSLCKDRVFPIHLIDHDNQRNVHYGCECTLSELEPIPLTPEILEKCGFEEAIFTDGEKYWLKDETDYSPHPRNLKIPWKCYRVCYYMNDWYFEVHKDKYGHTPSIQTKIHSVHQLMNLYFALTNTELNINL
jgi:hypothetical protein